MKMPTIFHIFYYVGFQHMKKKKARTFFTILGVASGIALFTAIDLINRATAKSFKENFTVMAGQANLTVTASDIGFPEDKLSLVEKIPGVKRAVPMIEERAYFTDKEGSETLNVFGVDLLKEQSVRSYQLEDGSNLMDDPLVFLNQPDSIIISTIFAKKHGLQIDSKLKLTTAYGAKNFTVRGILNPEGPAKAFGGSVAIMDIDGARVSFGKEGKMDRVDIVAADGEDIEALKTRCSDALGAGYTVDKPEGHADTMGRLIKTYQIVLSLLSLLAMLVGLFMITNSIGMAVSERRKEIGILRAVGITKVGVFAVFLTEAALMGVLGALIGSVLGWYGAREMVETVTASMSVQSMTQLSIPVIVWQYSDLIRGVLIGLIASLLAAGWPSFKATRIHPIEAIRSQTKAQDAKSLSKLYLFGSLFCLLFMQISSMNGWNGKYAWVEVLNQTSSMLGAILITPWAVRALVTFFVFVAKKTPFPSVRLSQENLLKDPLRISSNVLMLMVGLILMVLISAVNSSFKYSIDAWTQKVLLSDLVVSSPGQTYSYKTQPLHQDLKKELEKVPTLAPALKYPITGLRVIHLMYGNRNIVIKAYDEPEPVNYSIFDVRDGDAREAGKALFHSGEPTVMVSKNFADHFQKKTGDEIILDSPSGSIRARVIAQVNDFSSNDGVIYINRATYAKHWKDQLVTLFYLKLKDGVDLESMRRTIDSEFGQKKNLVVRLNSELRTSIMQNIDKSFSYAKAMEGAALFIALLGLLNALYVSVMERTRELGLLHAIGMTRSQIISMVVFESMAQGLIASFLAVSLGVWMSYLWIHYRLQNILGWSVQYYFPGDTVLAASLLGILVAFFAGLFPASKAAHLEVKEALSYE